MQLRPQFVKQTAIQTERCHGCNSVDLVLPQLAQNVRAVVILRASARSIDLPHVRMVRNKTRQNRLAARFDDLRGFWPTHFVDWTHRDNAVSLITIAPCSIGGPPAPSITRTSFNTTV